ncbi:14562_t:CDS:2 [Cetraspora pellucida]|uniref:14562_t:CDS:1 n=1 Tax=Cetraspora pellucida TaxID=1433469 RepID=A0A9N9P460_9GLOM|nr:14562_t:CDS:2 [Cetraspora pellucida]
MTEINILSDNKESITNESDTENDIIETNLKVGDIFRDWDAVDNAVNMYAKRNRFVVIKFHKDLDSVDKNIVRHHVYTIVIDLTIFDNSHNHECDPVTINLTSKNSCIPQKILVKIEHYTINGHLGTGQQYDLLVKEFLQYIIKKKGLYNAIQKFREVQVHDELDALTMFLYLMKLCNHDNDYVVVSYNDLAMTAAIQIAYSNTRYLLCMFHIIENAKYSTAKVFTAGVEATQHVEAINGILKKHLDRKNFIKEISKAMITIDQIKEFDVESTDLVEHIYNTPQIRLHDLLSDINNDEIQEIWEVYYIATMLSTSKLHYIVILSDSTSLFWPVETTNHITIFQKTKTYTTKSLHYINQIQIANNYTSTIKENVNNKIKFSATMSVTKISIQFAVEEGATPELTGLFMEFIMKYHRNTELNIEEVRYLSDKTQKSPNKSNPEYYKPKSHLPKHFKSLTEENNVQHISSSSKICSYCFEKGHNIKEYNQYKSDLADKKNN